jgi:hypothetical protein
MTKEEWRKKLAEASSELSRVADRVACGEDPVSVEGSVTHVSCVLDILLGDVEEALSRK